MPYAGLPQLWGIGWFIGSGMLVTAAFVLWRRRAPWAVALLAAGIAMSAVAAASVFTDSSANSGSSLKTETVAAPSGLNAACGAVGAGNVNVNLTWTASTTGTIDGYEILHDSPGGGINFTVVGTVGSAQTNFTHVIPVAVLGLGTHTYTVRATLDSWTSPNSNTDAVSITQVIVVVCTPL